MLLRRHLPRPGVPRVVVYRLAAAGGGVTEGLLRSSPWKPISNLFGLWHERARGAHAGVHRFSYAGLCRNCAKSIGAGVSCGA